MKIRMQEKKKARSDALRAKRVLIRIVGRRFKSEGRWVMLNDKT